MTSVNPEGIVGFYSYTFNMSPSNTWCKSDEFTIEGIDNCQFGIELFREGNTDNYLVSVRKSHKQCNLAKITVSILGEELTRIVRKWQNNRIFVKEMGTPYRIDIEVHCQIIWYCTTKDTIPVKAPLSPFSGFQNLYLNSSLSDLKISVDGEELSAHKVILATHSPVFLRMLETNMREKKENHLVIVGIELNVMKMVLSILYTGYDGDLEELEMAKKVLIVAERYDMKALKRLCEWKLFQKLNVTNVLDILDKADNSNAGTLRTGCLNFIVGKKQQIAKSKDWEMMCRNKPHLMGKLIQTFMISK